MEKSKPFSIQAPEQIAKDYAGNKQKIAEAMQMGVVDPTAGILAGMFIDRMRSAQMQEMTQPPTVAQQVMGGPPAQAPLAPAGGLGATAPATAPMAPAGPPMGAAPPMAGPPMGAAPPMDAMPPMNAAPPMGMAEGGLTTLPVPDYMFDEPQEDGMAGGGIVAFAQGDDIEVTAREGPESIHGIYRDPELNKTEIIEKLYQPQRKYGTKLTEFYEQIMSPEAQKKRRKEDMWMALSQIGSRMATTPGTLLQAASTGIREALPGAVAANKERRAEQRDAIKTLAQQEGLTNKEAMEVAKVAMDLTGKYADLRESGLNRDQQLVIQKMEDATQRYGIASQAASSRYSTSEGAAAARYTADQNARREAMALTREAGRFFDALTEESPQLKRQKAVDPIGYARAKTEYVRDYVYGPK